MRRCGARWWAQRAAGVTLRRPGHLGRACPGRKLAGNLGGTGAAVARALCEGDEAASGHGRCVSDTERARAGRGCGVKGRRHVGAHDSGANAHSSVCVARGAGAGRCGQTERGREWAERRRREGSSGPERGSGPRGKRGGCGFGLGFWVFFSFSFSFLFLNTTQTI